MTHRRAYRELLYYGRVPEGARKSLILLIFFTREAHPPRLRLAPCQHPDALVRPHARVPHRSWLSFRSWLFLAVLPFLAVHTHTRTHTRARASRSASDAPSMLFPFMSIPRETPFMNIPRET
jgi:hypothetical protein